LEEAVVPVVAPFVDPKQLLRCHQSAQGRVSWSHRRLGRLRLPRLAFFWIVEKSKSRKVEEGFVQDFSLRIKIATLALFAHAAHFAHGAHFAHAAHFAHGAPPHCSGVCLCREDSVW
jgi:hypothetical protein